MRSMPETLAAFLKIYESLGGPARVQGSRRALDGRNGTEIEMIRATLLVPENLRACMEGVETGRNDKHEHLLRQLERLRPTCVAW